MTQSPNSSPIVQAELQPLYYQWVMGRNRGDSNPLPPEKLKLLVDKAVLRRDQLSPQELALLEPSGQKIVTPAAPPAIAPQQSTTPSLSPEDSLKAKAEAVHLIVDGLKIMLLEEFKKKHEVDWEQVSEDEKERIAEKLVVENQGKSSKQLKIDFLMEQNKAALA